jgi:hypothetical protein
MEKMTASGGGKKVTGVQPGKKMQDNLIDISRDRIGRLGQVETGLAESIILSDHIQIQPGDTRSSHVLMLLEVGNGAVYFRNPYKTDGPA